VGIGESESSQQLQLGMRSVMSSFTKSSRPCAGGPAEGGEGASAGLGGAVAAEFLEILAAARALSRGGFQLLCPAAVSRSLPSFFMIRGAFV